MPTIDWTPTHFQIYARVRRIIAQEKGGKGNSTTYRQGDTAAFERALQNAAKR